MTKEESNDPEIINLFQEEKLKTKTIKLYTFSSLHRPKTIKKNSRWSIPHWRHYNHHRYRIHQGRRKINITCQWQTFVEQIFCFTLGLLYNVADKSLHFLTQGNPPCLMFVSHYRNRSKNWEESCGLNKLEGCYRIYLVLLISISQATKITQNVRVKCFQNQNINIYSFSSENCTAGIKTLIPLIFIFALFYRCWIGDNPSTWKTIFFFFF